MADLHEAVRVVIMGAAGRDFHNFNVVYRQDPHYRVVAFTAAQIPAIAGRRYPPALAGARYPEGIPVVDEAALAGLCRAERIDQVVLAYSDLSHLEAMHRASIALAAGADFLMLSPEHTMIRAAVPVIAVCAVRTGCGKSQTTRWLSARLKARGLKVAVIRHPMPYGDLECQAVQCFATFADLDAADCTVEEREEYEPHLVLGNTVYAGVDYAQIVRRAQAEADLILWDGGNNDFPFVRPDLHIVLVDPLRPGDETSHHPGETVLRMADIVLVAKSNSAAAADLATLRENVRRVRPEASLILGASPVVLDDPSAVQGRRVLVVEDGPSITHGGMAYGAGYVAATGARAAEIVDPRDAAVEEVAELYAQYPHIGRVLPAVGYHRAQLAALARTIERVDADLVVSATPCDLAALIRSDKPIVRARYEYAEAQTPGLGEAVDRFLDARGLGG
jgi:predicted GTPase